MSIKLIAIFTCLLCVCGLCLAESAGSGTQDDPWLIGADGDDVYAFIEGGTLWIDGSGRMADFEDGVPWDKEAPCIESVFVGSEITRIGKRAFAYIGTQAEFFDVYIGECVTEIGAYAFEGTNLSAYGGLSLPESVTKIEAGAFSNLSADSCISLYSVPEADGAFDQSEVTLYLPYALITDEYIASLGGTLTVVPVYRFYYTEDYGTDDISCTGIIYINEGDELNYDAEAYKCMDNCSFVRYDLVYGNLDGADLTDPELTVQLTGDVKVNIIYEENN